MGNDRPRRWHVAQWPPLAWAETAVKATAQAVGIVALARAFGGDMDRPEGVRLVAVILLAALSFGLLVAIADRLAEREVVGMVFVVTNNVAHWGVVLALLTSPGPGRLATTFFALMFVGELVKLAFLRTSGYRVRGLPPGLVTGLTSGYAAGYAVLLGFDIAG